MYGTVRYPSQSVYERPGQYSRLTCDQSKNVPQGELNRNITQFSPHVAVVDVRVPNGNVSFKVNDDQRCF